jgi:hypothetical protein
MSFFANTTSWQFHKLLAEAGEKGLTKEEKGWDFLLCPLTFNLCPLPGLKSTFARGLTLILAKIGIFNLPYSKLSLAIFNFFADRTPSPTFSRPEKRSLKAGCSG